jgi:DNA-directed RNA polymerase specialized sigma24 family protein
MSDEPGCSDQPNGIDLARVAEGIDMLPCLTRAVFLLHRWDSLSYAEIAQRCGISADEVEHRMVAALYTVRRRCDGDRFLLAYIRLALRPWRIGWYAWHRRRRDRLLGL